MDPTAIVVGSQSCSSRARSALPDAPVVEKREEVRRPARPKRAAAGFLRRFAARLDPSY
jgi:hypothetical protein